MNGLLGLSIFDAPVRALIDGDQTSLLLSLRQEDFLWVGLSDICFLLSKSFSVSTILPFRAMSVKADCLVRVR